MIFVNYAQYIQSDTLIDDKFEHNKSEVEIIYKLIQSIKTESSFNMNEIGIITPYRSQERKLKEQLESITLKMCSQLIKVKVWEKRS